MPAYEHVHFVDTASVPSQIVRSIVPDVACAPMPFGPACGSHAMFLAGYEELSEEIHPELGIAEDEK